MTAKKVGGGKLTRSETVTVRLDPKLRYLAELAARKHRRTLSSYIEWAIEESLQTVALAKNGVATETPIAFMANDLWDVDEADRFAKLALNCPELLTHEEQVIWKVIQERPDFYSMRGGIDYQFLRASWDIVKQYARGEISFDEFDAQLYPGETRVIGGMHG